ncbi:hypothetical protein AOQ84DRAFT_373900 [Glonium stellatum]|uniref:Uncharacterized protein n=1 Tax=Glonium stellatum TaxID=574774 RepID=A0A8E2F6T3_9PEZI|nr:hypothetical protein AOQ84DRAFT_373900 [Glonium stellatum]
MSHCYPPGKVMRRNERLNVTILAEQPFAAMFQCPHLHALSEGSSSPYCSADEMDTPWKTSCDPFESSDGSKRHSKIADTILSEVADWLDLNERDNMWAVRRRHLQRALPTPNEIAAHFATHPQTASSISESAEPSEVLLHLIAIQILASCYTLSQPLGAASLPSSLYLSKREPEFITSLRLHTQSRYYPAAGHHARNSSRDSSWPGLYSGPSPEDKLAEEVSRRRLLKRHGFGEDGSSTVLLESRKDLSKLTDGSPPSNSDSESRHQSADSHNSDSSSEECCFKKAWHSRRNPQKDPAKPICEGIQRHISTHSSSHSHASSKQETHRSNRPYPHYHMAIRPVLHAEPHPLFVQPVKHLHLRRTRSVPRHIRNMTTPSTSSLPYSRRNSSAPAITLPAPTRTSVIPQARHGSASTELLTALEFLNETQLGATSPQESIAEMPDIPASELSPSKSAETPVVGPSPQRQVRFASRGFSEPHEADSSEYSSAQSETGEGGEERGNVEGEEGSDEGDWSEDSEDRSGKRHRIRLTTV